MDSLDVVALTRALVDVDSTTGREGVLGRWVADWLRRRGYHVVEQRVESGRCNVFATLSPPLIVFSTHLDCVPPFFPSRQADESIFGRGACDAKGALAAQLVAAERLRAAGESRVGLLFVAGEERGSIGARAAGELVPGSRYVVNGEPTGNRLALATRGVWRVKLRATGRAAHSAYPELGVSAIEKLMSALVTLRALELPTDPVLGRTHYHVGLIAGGVAPNVVPAEAEAEVLFRTVGSREPLETALARLRELVTIEPVLEIPPATMTTVPEFDTDVFPYTTDVPLLTAWGEPLLYGPGSPTFAHTEAEHVRIEDLRIAVEGYVRLAHALLER